MIDNLSGETLLNELEHVFERYLGDEDDHETLVANLRKLGGTDLIDQIDRAIIEANLIAHETRNSMSMIPERESVAQAVTYIISALEIIARMAKDPTTYDEVAAEEAALWTVKNHIEWICSYLKEKRDGPKIRAMQ